MTSTSTPEYEPSTVDKKFAEAIGRFSHSLMDLREFSELIETLIKKHKLQELEAALHRYDGLGEALMQFDESFGSEIHKLNEGCPEGQPNCGSTLEFKVRKDGDGGTSFFVHGAHEDIKEFDKTFMTILKSETGVMHLHQSSLISLVSTIEVFLSKLLHIFFDKHPSAVNSSDKQFTFRELSNFSSLDDARKYLISFKIENLLRGSLEDWIEYFSNEMKLKLPWLGRHRDELVENFLRRNLFVHNGGVVNKIYLSKVSQNLAKPEILNKQLSVSKGYLFSAIDRFESAFLQTAFELWEKCEKKSEMRPALIVGSTYDALQNKRWRVAEEIAHFMQTDKVADEATILMARINGWIARKNTQGLDAIRDEVIAFDFSAKGDLFLLARQCLLEEEDAAIALCKRLHKAKILDLGALMEWPLFDKLRTNTAMVTWLDMLKEKATQKRKAKQPTNSTKTVNVDEPLGNKATITKLAPRPNRKRTGSTSMPEA